MRNSRTLLWILAGAAVGAAAIYILNRDDKDEVINDLKDFARKTKDTISDRLNRLGSMADSATDRAEDAGRQTANHIKSNM